MVGGGGEGRLEVRPGEGPVGEGTGVEDAELEVGAVVAGGALEHPAERPGGVVEATELAQQQGAVEFRLRAAP